MASAAANFTAFCQQAAKVLEGGSIAGGITPERTAFRQARNCCFERSCRRDARIRSTSNVDGENSLSAATVSRACGAAFKVANFSKNWNGIPAIRIKKIGAMRYPASATPEENRRDAEGNH